MVEASEHKTSKYNSGLAQIYRIDELWKNAHKLRLAGRFMSWSSEMDGIWCELSRDLFQGDDFDEWDDKYQAIEKKLNDTGNFKDSKPNDFQGLDAKDIENRNKQYKLLIDKDILLRKLENHVGKGTDFENEYEDDM